MREWSNMSSREMRVHNILIRSSEPPLFYIDKTNRWRFKKFCYGAYLHDFEADELMDILDNAYEECGYRNRYIIDRIRDEFNIW